MLLMTETKSKSKKLITLIYFKQFRQTIKNQSFKPLRE